MKDEGKQSNSFFNIISFFALVILAILVLVNALNIFSEQVKMVLETIKNVLILLIISVNAYKFVKGKAKGWKITYWISLLVFIAGTILIWFIKK